MPRKAPPPSPTCFVPSCPADFVGQAGKVAEVLLRKAERLRAQPDQPLRLREPDVTGKCHGPFRAQARLFSLDFNA